MGDVIAVPLGDGRVGFGLVLESPLVAFFDLCAADGKMPPIAEIVSSPVAFRIWVMNRDVTDEGWPLLGRVEVPPRLRERPLFFKQDAISGRITVGWTGAEEIPSSAAEVASLERGAVWSGIHVVDRLRDHFDGRPNKWVESLRVKG